MMVERDAYLLDTNVISEFANGMPDPQVKIWLESHQDQPFYLCGVTIGELEKGITRLPDSRRKSHLAKWLNDKLLVQYEGYILQADLETFRLWGRISAEAETSGKKMQVVDALISAFAKQHQLKLVTRNVSDFASAGIEVINPWESA